MIILCPKCRTKLTIDMKHLDEDTALVCVGCRSILKARLEVDLLAEGKGGPVSQRPSPSAERSTPSAERSNPPAAALNGEEKEDRSFPSTIDPNKVLVAIDGEGTKELVREILAGASLKMVEAPGKEILSTLNRHRPAIALIDVGLPDGLGSDFCAMIKKDDRLKDTVVILLASIYDKNNKYRRGPSSLFGADDYIERHNVGKDLLVRIRMHLGRKETNGTPPRSAQTERIAPAPPVLEKESSFSEPPKTVNEDQEASFDLEQTSDSITTERSLPPPEEKPAQESKETEEARRLARIIVSDIVLYNKKKVEEGLRSNRFFELLKEEIEEGRTHYNSRVSPELQKSRDLYKEAFDDFIKKKKGTPS